ncbi:hypothetical protein BO78DRAFT_392482 [Aspergillus sclerotiicarbonarius CBS 121057]|uniref:Uncharacterized protein n=1 Tax=Aspergillus sclerotiicarbonarius (strain CBS 121057 / IBT 28362) TaxID=1448318 RepID=A0A319F3P9_ASPSB|nr:hypothetical protein BO78DRAFT_392482 [Aspergillus sclerotiicarbonarius CBS 121057]
MKRGNILSNHRTRPHRTPSPDPHPRENGRAGPNPHIILDMNLLSRLWPLEAAAFGRIHGM